MNIYIGLIVVFLLVALLIKLCINNKAQQERWIAMVGMFLIFLLLALKGETVGSDIDGYKLQYEIAAEREWGEYDYIYWEQGYTIITMFLSKLGVSFQIFAAIVYALWCGAIYQLIKRFSTNSTLSVIIFICYAFLVFCISGLRQTLAMTLCLYAFFIFLHPKKWTKIIAIAIPILTTYIHQSAIVFLGIFAILLFKKQAKITIWAVITVGTALLRTLIWGLVSYFYEVRITDAEIGGNFVFLLGMVAFISFSYYYKTYNKNMDKKQLQKGSAEDFDAFFVRCAFLCVLCYIVFTGGKLLRANMYYTLFLIPAIPRMIDRYVGRTKMLMALLMGCFMIYLFVSESIIPNQLDILPYQFFWRVERVM